MVSDAHPKTVYSILRCGASPSRMLKEDVPELGSEERAIDNVPAWC
jgi:hypothetical protein